MLKFIALIAVLGLSLGSMGVALSQPAGSGLMRPLDLPSGGRGDDADEVDVPETINFYGGEYEGDGFFWCLDKSGSMAWGDQIGQLKAETTEALQSLSSESEFSLVAFSTGHITFSMFPRAANAAAKAEATAWVTSLEAEGWTCLGPAGVEIVNISNLSDKANKQVLVLSDGEPYCDGVDTSAECLTNIRAANWQNTPVNTIYISSDAAGITFMQQLAALNNGTFYQPQ